MDNVPTVATSLAQLKALPIDANSVAVLNSGGRSGEFIWRQGSFADSVSRDTLEGIYVKSDAVSAAIGAWVRLWDGVHGRPEWFGAEPEQNADCLDALRACHLNSPVTLLSAVRYPIRATFVFDGSNKRLSGTTPSYASGPASEIQLIGTNAASVTVIQIGTANSSAPARGQIVEDVTFSRSSTANGSVTGNAIDSVKAVVLSGTTNSELRRCRALNSPIGFHATGTSNLLMADLNCAPATSSTADFSIGYLLGGYSTNYGFVGNNGSLRLYRCTAYEFPNATYSAHTLLFGLPADTWLYDCEGSHGKRGIDVNGQDATAAVIQSSGSCQDITLFSCKMDNFSEVAFYIHDMSPDADVTVEDFYYASSGTGVAINNVGAASNGTIIGGSVRIGSGRGLGGTIGITANKVGSLTLGSTVLIRNAQQPVILNTCGTFDVKAQVQAIDTPTTAAVQLLSCFRGIIAPAIRGAAGKVMAGVTADSATNYTLFDGSKIDYGCFVTVNPAQKIRYSGADARSSSAFTGANNMLIGITS